MKLLLDTHALIWWWNKDLRLPQAVRDVLTTSGSEIFASAASAWEIATKRRLNKLPELGQDFNFMRFASEQDFQLLSIKTDHAERGGSYEASHGDPFDRLLAAQSELEQLTLVTCDAAFAAFPCKTFW